MKKFLFCFGTRPEAIKMAPVIKEVERLGHKSIVCISGQHRDMILPFLKFFGIKENYNLDVMKQNQSLSSMTAAILLRMEDVIKDADPDYLVVQGDTTTTFTCALAGFYHKVPVVHIEAGLRTGDIYSPFPEEGNRKIVSAFAKFFFPPTEVSAENLRKEGITENVIVTGNTSIDSLRMTMDKIKEAGLDQKLLDKYPFMNSDKKLILVTTHRRENHGEPLDNICKAILKLSENKELQFVIPVHLNPNVKDVIYTYFDNIENVHLLKPLDYVDFSWFMHKSFLILTDSGGVQEEGPYFKRPILVLRENTERPEGISAKVSKLVGSDTELIIKETNKLLSNPTYYETFSQNENPYGNGHASEKIVSELI